MHVPPSLRCLSTAYRSCPRGRRAQARSVNISIDACERNDPGDTDARVFRRHASRDQPRKSFIMAIIGSSISKSGTICAPAGVMSFALRMRDAMIVPASFSLSV